MSFLHIHTTTAGRRVTTRSAYYNRETDHTARQLEAERITAAAFKALVSWAADNEALDGLIVEAREFAALQTRRQDRLIKEALAASEISQLEPVTVEA